MVQTTVRGARYGVLAGAAGAAMTAHATSLALNVIPNAWLTLTDKSRWSLAPDAMLSATACVIVCAPVFGVVVTSGHRANRQKADRHETDRHKTDRHKTDQGVASSVLTVGAAVSMFTLVSALLTIGWRFGQGDALVFAARSHITLAAVAMALATWGAVCGLWFRNAMDAAGVSLLTTLVAAGGLLVGGTFSAELPRSLVAAGLIASPLVAVSSASQIDLFHSDVLYQISPLAHVQIDYPTWTLATACYLTAAGLCILMLTATSRRIALSSHR